MFSFPDRIMGDKIEDIVEVMEEPICNVPMIADVEIGHNWGDKKKYDKTRRQIID